MSDQVIACLRQLAACKSNPHTTNTVVRTIAEHFIKKLATEKGIMYQH